MIEVSRYGIPNDPSSSRPVTNSKVFKLRIVNMMGVICSNTYESHQIRIFSFSRAHTRTHTKPWSELVKQDGQQVQVKQSCVRVVLPSPLAYLLTVIFGG